MEPLRPHELWFFREDAVLSDECYEQRKEKNNIYHPLGLHYPTIPNETRFLCRCPRCGGMSKTRRCLVCDPLPEAPLDLMDEEPDAVPPEQEPVFDRRIRRFTAVFRARRINLDKKKTV